MAKKGNIPWNKGMKYTKEQYHEIIEKRKQADRSYITKEWKEQHSKSIKTSKKYYESIKHRKRENYNHSKETRLKIGLGNKGHIAWNKGLKYINEHINGIKNPMAKRIAIHDVDNILIDDHLCISDIEKKYNISRYYILKVCNHKLQDYNGYKFEIWNGK